jgi:hypothetical protein
MRLSPVLRANEELDPLKYIKDIIARLLDVSTTNVFVMRKTTGFLIMSVPINRRKNQEIKNAVPKIKLRTRSLPSLRILVERVISGVKRCYIVHDVLRNTTAHFDDLVMEIVCGLHYFRTTLRDNA